MVVPTAGGAAADIVRGPVRVLREVTPRLFMVTLPAPLTTLMAVPPSMSTSPPMGRTAPLLMVLMAAASSIRRSLWSMEMRLDRVVMFSWSSAICIMRSISFASSAAICIIRSMSFCWRSKMSSARSEIFCILIISSRAVSMSKSIRAWVWFMMIMSFSWSAAI